MAAGATRSFGVPTTNTPSVLFQGETLESAELARPLKIGSTFTLEMQLRQPYGAYFNMPGVEQAFRLRPVPGLALVDVRASSSWTVVVTYKVVGPTMAVWDGKGNVPTGSGPYGTSDPGSQIGPRMGQARMGAGPFAILAYIVIGALGISIALAVLVSGVKGTGIYEIFEQAKEIVKEVGKAAGEASEGLKWVALAVIGVVILWGIREVKSVLPRKVT